MQYGKVSNLIYICVCVSMCFHHHNHIARKNQWLTCDTGAPACIAGVIGLLYLSLVCKNLCRCLCMVVLRTRTG